MQIAAIGKKIFKVFLYTVGTLLLMVLSAIIILKFTEPVDPVSTGNELYISRSTKEQINSTVKKVEYVKAVQISTVDFTKNVRIISYMSIEDPIVRNIYDEFISRRAVGTPIFTTEKERNAKILRLISGDFFCMPFSETRASVYAPALSSIMSTVCAYGIPPNKYGEFSGIITVYLSKEPSPEEQEKLFYFTRDISTQISDDNNLVDENKNKP